MGKKLLTFALCLFLGMSVALAQNRIITGTVTGAEDGFPIHKVRPLKKSSG